MKKIQGLQSVEDTRKELITCRLNDLVTDVFEEKKIEVLVNILPSGRPIANADGKIFSIGFFVSGRLCRYINVKEDSPAKMFMRCSEILYQMLTQGD